MDVHVPQAITHQLRRRGVQVLTAQEDGTGALAECVDQRVCLDVFIQVEPEFAHTAALLMGAFAKTARSSARQRSISARFRW